MKSSLLSFCAAALLVCGCTQQKTPHMAPDKVTLGAIDEPASGSRLNHPFPIRGWALSPQGIEWVAVYTDGNLLGYAHLGDDRRDVYKANDATPGSATSGWHFDAHPGLFSEGSHSITVEACSKTGASYSIGAITVDIVH
jgi:hypothetical protein